MIERCTSAYHNNVLNTLTFNTLGNEKNELPEKRGNQVNGIRSRDTIMYKSTFKEKIIEPDSKIFCSYCKCEKQLNKALDITDKFHF